MELREKVANLPRDAGVYLFKDALGTTLYVGKAGSLRSRVRSYFLETRWADAKTGSLVREIADVDYIDSAGLGALVSAYTSVKNEGGELKLVYLTKKVQDLLQMTRLYTVFEVFDDEAAALNSFDKSTASTAC